MANGTILLGAVAYDPKVVVIWEGIRDFFHELHIPIDFVLFSNYERQVEKLLRGHIEIAWNTPLAHVQVKHRTGGASKSLAMRDSDRDFRSRVLVRTDACIKSIGDLAGRRLAVGSRDSTQAHILPLHFLKEAGVELDRVEILSFDSHIGKHGDTGASELDVLQALRTGTAEAGTIGELVWIAEQAAGHVDAGLIESLWTTPAFDHCMFDAMPTFDDAAAVAFQQALFAMKWENPRHRRLLELEGLKQWLPPREEGYAALIAACHDQKVAL